MAKFAQGVNHVLPNVDNDDAICDIGKGRTIECMAGQEIPADVLQWFKRHKPGWIAGGAASVPDEKAVGEAPEKKMVGSSPVKK